MGKDIHLNTIKYFEIESESNKTKLGHLNDREIQLLSLINGSDLNFLEKKGISTASHLFHLALPLLFFIAINTNINSAATSAGHYMANKTVEFFPSAAQFVVDKIIEHGPSAGKFAVDTLSKNIPTVVHYAADHPVHTASTVYATLIPATLSLKLLAIAGIRFPGASIGISSQTILRSGMAIAAISSGGAIIADHVIGAISPIAYQAISNPMNIPNLLLSSAFSILNSTSIKAITEAGFSALATSIPAALTPTSPSAVVTGLGMTALVGYKIAQLARSGMGFFW